MRPPFVGAVLLTFAGAAFAAEPSMIIHEWGTFTHLEDETGRCIGGINSDDEPLPPFTHQLARQWNVGNAASQRSNILMKGFPRSHPDVILRLETPVLYFHPSSGNWPSPVSVHVEFRGGCLTQFYPDAASSNLEHHITAQTVSHLDWSDLSIGGNKPGPVTISHVWTAPRQVQAADVTTPKGESERFLFYRGVGHIDAPLRLVTNASGIDIETCLDPSFGKDAHLPIPHLWYCRFGEDGRVAFRHLEPIMLSAESSGTVAHTPAAFSNEEFSADRLIHLKSEMRAVLVEQGLFADEADALLSTWELSYFKSSGVRLFYIVPREWTDHYLPLQISTGSKVTRVMVGRIDLVTSEQRSLLRQIADNPDRQANDAALWKTYDQLGRFRNALLLDERQHRDTPSLEKFIALHGLGPAE